MSLLVISHLFVAVLRLLVFSLFLCGWFVSLLVILCVCVCFASQTLLRPYKTE